MLPWVQLQSSKGVADPCFWLGFCQGAAWTITSLGARGTRGPGQDFTPGREQGSWEQLGSAKGPDHWAPLWWWGGLNVKPESQSTGQDQGGEWLGRAVVVLETGTPTSQLRWMSKGLPQMGHMVEAWFLVRLDRASKAIGASTTLRCSVRKPCFFSCL